MVDVRVLYIFDKALGNNKTACAMKLSQHAHLLQHKLPKLEHIFSYFCIISKLKTYGCKSWAAMGGYRIGSPKRPLVCTNWTSGNHLHPAAPVAAAWPGNGHMCHFSVVFGPALQSAGDVQSFQKPCSGVVLVALDSSYGLTVNCFRTDVFGPRKNSLRRSTLQDVAAP